MRQQNTKATVPVDVVPERRTERYSPRFRPGGRFWNQVSDACRQEGKEGGREISAPRPFVHSAQLMLGSNSYIQQHSSYFLHVVRSNVSCGGAYLTIAHVLLLNTLIYASEPL